MGQELDCHICWDAVRADQVDGSQRSFLMLGAAAAYLQHRSDLGIRSRSRLWVLGRDLRIRLFSIYYAAQELSKSSLGRSAR